VSIFFPCRWHWPRGSWRKTQRTKHIRIS